MKKTISLVTALLLSAMTLIGCGYGSTKEEAEPVFNVLGYDIPYEVYRFYAMTAKSDYGLLDADGKTVTDDPGKLAEAEQAAMDAIFNLCAALKVAEQFGFRLSDEVISYEVESYFEELKNSYESESDFHGDMEAVYMNKNTILFVYGASYARELAYEKALDDGTIDTSEEGLRVFFASDDLIRVKHILLSTDFGNAEEMASVAYEKALAAENFDEVVDLYTRNGIYAEDRYLTRGETLEAFEDACFALAVGELSEIVESSAGYSVIKRYEKSEEDFDSLREDLLEKYKVYQFNEYLREAKESISSSSSGISYYTDAYAKHPFAEIE